MTAPASRRAFLFAAAAARFPQLIKANGSADEAYWEMVRAHFAFSEQRTPMNAANLCPAPRMVSERVVDLTLDMDRDCSFQNREKFTRTLEESRAQMAEMLGVESDEIALVRNTSEANNIVNNGLALGSRDEVVLWEQNHPTNNVAWQVRAARFGFTVKRVATPAQPQTVDELIVPFEKALTGKTRVLALTHVSNSTGVRLPVKELCQLAQRRGVYVHVDGAQSWGALRVNLRELGCDSYSASAHKWFMGPREVGILYVKKERMREIWPSCVAPGWGDDVEPDVAGARKFESMGQRDDARLAAVRNAAEFHAAVGAAQVEARILELARMLKEEARALDLSLVTPLQPELSAGVVVIRAPGAKAREIHEALYRQWGIAGAATGGLRLCPHIYNTRGHLERVAAALRSMRSLFA